MGFREGNKHFLDLDVELVTVIPEDSIIIIIMFIDCNKHYHIFLIFRVMQYNMS